MTPPDKWRFSEAIQPDRVALLTDLSHSFDGIVERLLRGAIVCACWEWGLREEVVGRVRADFEIAVNEGDVDLFHNGRDGYRARYYQSVEAGEAANAACLRALASPLRRGGRSWGLHLQAPSFPDDWSHSADAEVERSLLSDGAKVWISEHALTQRYGPDWAPESAEDVVHELLVKRWIEAIRGRAGQGGQNARLAGTRAFRVDRISVKGGFIAPGRPELGAVVPYSKRTRSHQINSYGFT